MYQLLSAQNIVETILALSAPYLADKNNIDDVGLKKAYRKYLYSIQPYCPYMEKEQLFYADSETETHFKNYFANEEIDLTDYYQNVDLDKVLYPDAQKRMEVLKKSFDRMVNKDPVFGNIFKMVMNTVFCTVSKNLGGTSVNPKYIGVMCAHYDMDSEEDVVPELITHEFTHNVLTLDEHRFGHYKNYELLKNPRTHIDAIALGINIRFPLNRILHSMIVSAEIIMLRDAYVGHKDRKNQHVSNEKMLARAQKYISAIDANQEALNIFTERGMFLYKKCKEFYNHYLK